MKEHKVVSGVLSSAGRLFHVRTGSIDGETALTGGSPGVRVQLSPRRCVCYGNCHRRSSKVSRTAVCGRNVHQNSASVMRKQLISSNHEKVTTNTSNASTKGDYRVSWPPTRTSNVQACRQTGVTLYNCHRLSSEAS